MKFKKIKPPIILYTLPPSANISYIFLIMMDTHSCGFFTEHDIINIFIKYT